MKTCTKCKVCKPTSEFNRNKKERDGYNGSCKDCHRAYVKVRGGRLLREAAYRRRYGITIADYDLMFAEQGGVCLICEESTEHLLRVDHCHTSGVVRGLLCGSCNKGLGHFRDDPKRLRRAEAYVTREPIHYSNS